jgi:hypothetical protein
MLLHEAFDFEEGRQQLPFFLFTFRDVTPWRYVPQLPRPAYSRTRRPFVRNSTERSVKKIANRTHSNTVIALSLILLIWRFFGDGDGNGIRYFAV